MLPNLSTITPIALDLPHPKGMMTETEFLNDYYELRIASVKGKNPFYSVQAVIKRRDTGEIVALQTKLSKNEKSGTKEVRALVLKKYEDWTKPQDWNCPARIVLFKYLEAKNRLDAFFCFSEKKTKRTLAYFGINEHFRFMSELRKATKMETLEIVKKIDRLSEKEKIRLLIAKPEEYETCLSSGCSLDILTAKSDIYEYIINPSSSIKSARRKHNRLTKQAYRKALPEYEQRMAESRRKIDIKKTALKQTTLNELAKAVEAMTYHMPEFEAEEVKGSLQKFVNEAMSGHPDRKSYQPSAVSLKEVSVTMGKKGEPVIKLMHSVLKLLT